MSVQQIIGELEKLLDLHKSLLSLSKEKTERIKNNEIDSFNELLMTERKHIQAIEQLEKKRIQLTEEWFNKHAEDRERTISELIEAISDEAEKKSLEALYDNLIIVLAELKQQEKLNRDLAQQSLQFIELSLDMFQPVHNKNLNYNQPNQQKKPNRNTSVFDSKA